MSSENRNQVSIEELAAPVVELDAAEAAEAKGGLLPAVHPDTLTTNTKNITDGTSNTATSPGTGFLRSTDGGKTW